MLIEQVLSDELRSLEPLATERTEPSVGRELLGVHLYELLDLLARLFDAQLLGLIRFETLFELDEWFELRLELFHVRLGVVGGGA